MSSLSAPNPSRPAPAYVGTAICAVCHVEETDAWQGSHHDLAMQEANARTVLGNFGGEEFTYRGVVTTFFKRGTTYYVNTDGPDGELSDFPIRYVIGVTPIQQYLIEFPGGRMQVLSVSWDSRPKSAGGQRWFHLYSHEKIDHTDALHWTGIYQNWNLQCAECHSTALRKGYDVESDTYNTTWKELNVACEGCHGAGSRHVEWAKSPSKPKTAEEHHGFAHPTASRWLEAWTFPTVGAAYAKRDRPASPAVNNTCSACHARRSTLADRDRPGAPLADTHRLALLTEPNYHADGQQREEVYTWGSFLQSRMHARGVTCMDCHEPHTATLRAAGNALCSRCHNANVFDTSSHHFHETGTSGAQCVACHMPATNYMVIDPRRDHSLRIPRPDLAQSMGTPDACTQCHTGKSPIWAAAAIDGWLGKQWRQRTGFGPVLHAGSTQGARAIPDLLTLARDNAQPPLVRATAAEMLVPYMNPLLLPFARELLEDPAPEVRISALAMIEPVDPVNRFPAAESLLTDPVRGVRIEAARVLAGMLETEIPRGRREAWRRALEEYITVQNREADWPVASVNLGDLFVRLGRFDDAVAAYRRALKRDPEFPSAWVNLADAWRVQGRESEVRATLQEGLSKLPASADLRHALGLSQVRAGDLKAALSSLAEAVRLAPESARYAYVRAIALHSAGRATEALEALREADRKHPSDISILGALVSIEREMGNQSAALAYAQKIAEALPDDPQVKAMVEELSR